MIALRELLSFMISTSNGIFSLWLNINGGQIALKLLCTKHVLRRPSNKVYIRLLGLVEVLNVVSPRHLHGFRNAVFMWCGIELNDLRNGL